MRIKVFASIFMLVAMKAAAFEQCSAKTEFCPEDGSFQGCRVIVDKVERFYIPNELSAYDCRNFCEYLANDYYPWP